MPELSDVQRDLLALAADLKRLEAEYTMFFNGRLPRPPWETRGRVEATIKRWGRGHIQSTSDRFRFEMLQSRFQSLIDLWDRAPHVWQFFQGRLPEADAAMDRAAAFLAARVVKTA